MKINWIEMEDCDSKLKIEKTNFNRNLTLLVGLSGEGKTQILRAVRQICLLAIGKAKITPSKASISFSIGQKEYQWDYELEWDNSEFMTEIGKMWQFCSESLKINGEEIFHRNGNMAKLKDYEQIPPVKSAESLISQYQSAKYINEVYYSMQKVVSINMETSIYQYYSSSYFQTFKDTLRIWEKKGILNEANEDQIREKIVKLPVPMKLYILRQYYEMSDSLMSMYTDIFDNIKELFPEISDIGFDEKIENECSIYIVTYDQKIWQNDISNGMLKSMYFLIQLITMPQNSTVCIDEFENGLGVNCIDVLVELLLTCRSDLQFIITSHHPKILNGLEPNYWKIVERNRNIITTNTPPEDILNGPIRDSYQKLIEYWESTPKYREKL